MGEVVKGVLISLVLIVLVGMSFPWVAQAINWSDREARQVFHQDNQP